MVRTFPRIQKRTTVNDENTSSPMNVSIPSFQVIVVVIYCRQRVCKCCNRPSSNIVLSQHPTNFRLIFHRNVHGSRLHACNTSFKHTLHCTTLLDMFMQETLVSFKIAFVDSVETRSQPQQFLRCLHASIQRRLLRKKAKRIQTDPLYEFTILRPNWLLTTS